MKLLTKPVRASLPPLYATADEADPLLRVKFFYPDFSWTWYATEFDGTDVCFGLIDGGERELGYFSLRELAAQRGPWGCPLERDRGFLPCRLSALPR